MYPTWAINYFGRSLHFSIFRTFNSLNRELKVSSFTRTNSNTKPPAAPGIDTRPVRTGTTRITTYPNKSPHLKSSTVRGHGVKRGTTHRRGGKSSILNSNLYEPADQTRDPNLPNERPPNERHPTNPGKRRPPTIAAPMNPANETAIRTPPPAKPTITKRARAKWPPAKPNFPNHTPAEAGLFPPRRPTRRGHRVPYTRFGGCVVLVGTFYHATPDPTNAQIRPRAKHGPRSHPYPRSSTSHNIYEDETNTAPHTRFGGCVAILGISTARYPTRQMHRPGPKQNTGLRRPPYPRPSIFRNNETRNKYGATHPPKRVIIQ
ncbi:hypothetical protein BS47DRAFT_1366171 [Hydnum rufescens UP504]|uniref:Uncharacterized protein n=1 Tax=Hydnum rufescens UP504 TaxID=1448309 RepID=A0A9P6ALQ8_9AGAM|nr:hypothetical protein BS47DRAFT_1366171 [Hydnum rufescens UP504]